MIRRRIIIQNKLHVAYYICNTKQNNKLEVAYINNTTLLILIYIKLSKKSNMAFSLINPNDNILVVGDGNFSYSHATIILKNKTEWTYFYNISRFIEVLKKNIQMLLLILIN